MHFIPGARPGLAATAVTALTLAALTATGAQAATASRVAVATGSTPWKAAATAAGPLADSAAVDLTVVLQLHDKAGADALATAVSDPGNAAYGRYVDAAAFRSRFAPTDADVAAVSGWLTGAGFTVTSVPANHLWVRVHGTAAAAAQAFGVPLEAYRAGGRTLRAPAGAATVPSSVAGLVAGITGLSSSSRLNRPDSTRDDRSDQADLPGTRATTAAGTSVTGAGASGVTTAGRVGSAPPPDAFVNGTPCSRWYGEKKATTLPTAYGVTAPYAPCGYDGKQLRSAYELGSSRFTGAGTTIAIIDAYASPTMRADASTYAARHGDAPYKPGQYTEYLPDSYQYGYDDTVNGDICGEQGWYGEQALDIEVSHAMAPKANIVYVAGASCDDPELLAAMNTVVDKQLANIVSNSWGDLGEPDPVADAALLAAYHAVLVQGAAEGIGFFFSSGDNGDEVDNAGFRTADYPATDPWVTAVGGTSLAVNAEGERMFETGWGTARSLLTNGAWDPTPPGVWLYGAGGGTSQTFAQPAYQRGVVPASISKYYSSKPGRAVPDIAAVGDPTTGFKMGQTQTFPDGTVAYSEFRIGGTSLSSPLMAGIQAIADQVQGRHHGFANPAIYRTDSGSFNDVRPLGRTIGIVRSEFANGVDAADGMTISLRTIDQTQSIFTRRGYDDVTGRGTPKGSEYVRQLGRG